MPRRRYRPNLKSLFISVQTSIKDALEVIDQGQCGIALVVDDRRRLVGTLTDGDIRRSLLKGHSLDTPAAALLHDKPASSRVMPISASVGADPSEWLQLMREKGIRQLPLTDDRGSVVDLVMLDQLVPVGELGRRYVENLDLVCVLAGVSLKEAMRRIDANMRGIVLVVDEDRHLLGTVTDGDIRRAILRGMNLDDSVETLLKQKTGSRYARPIAMPDGTEPSRLLRTMERRKVFQLPLVDEENRVVDLVTLNDLLGPSQQMPTAMIMAGGFGKRLWPLTQETPKPMLPVGDQPLMEHIIGQLREAGINHVNISTHFMREKIERYFGDGSRFGISIEYVTEEHPLGTAGALGLLEPSGKPILVVNGDVLSRVNLRAMFVFHEEHHADLTVGVRKYEIEVPYGVVETEGTRIVKIAEKPVLRLFINAGIYLVSPSVLPLVPKGERFDMTDFIARLLKENRIVVSFPIIEYWMDIGQRSDYERAQRDFQEGRIDR